MPGSLKRHLPEARLLYARGQSCAAVGKALGLALSTVYRWKKQETKAGVDWNALRGSMADASPRALVIGLEALLADVLADGSLPPAAKAHALAEANAVLTSERAHLAEAAGVARFAGWAARELPPEPARVIVDAIARYSEEARR